MDSASRRYQIEKKILQELCALQSLQQRAPKANEQILVKRISEDYRKAGLSVEFRDFNGPYNFREFEKYLFDQLELLRTRKNRAKTCQKSKTVDNNNNGREMCDIDIQKLAEALKKMNATKSSFEFKEQENKGRQEEVQLIPAEKRHLSRKSTKNPSNLEIHNSVKCHHATKGYTPTPCSAYVGSGRKGTVPYKYLNFEISSNPRLTNDPLIRKLIEENDENDHDSQNVKKDLKKSLKFLRNRSSTSNSSNISQIRIY